MTADRASAQDAEETAHAKDCTPELRARGMYAADCDSCLDWALRLNRFVRNEAPVAAEEPAQPVDVAAVGDGDRETARRALPPWTGATTIEAVAAALAVERQRAIASVVEPFEKLAAEWAYKGEFGWGPWQAGEGPDIEGQVLDDAADRIRAVIAEVAGRAGSGEAGR